ncbi:hypothetical protein D2Q93_09490 [Alicyclobacillaceae bacterium I2511]|nr:hypothetical protein D2Q93_09490 [Alicyclobacillaceae bacterium I2511]
MWAYTSAKVRANGAESPTRLGKGVWVWRNAEKNTVDFVEEVAVPQERVISLADAKVQFLRDIRGLAKQTQRWHRENLNALEKVLSMQGMVIDDCRKLTVSFLKEHFVF